MLTPLPGTWPSHRAAPQGLDRAPWCAGAGGNGAALCGRTRVQSWKHRARGKARGLQVRGCSRGKILAAQLLGSLLIITKPLNLGVSEMQLPRLLLSSRANWVLNPSMKDHQVGIWQWARGHFY